MNETEHGWNRTETPVEAPVPAGPDPVPQALPDMPVDTAIPEDIAAPKTEEDRAKDVPAEENPVDLPDTFLAVPAEDTSSDVPRSSVRYTAKGRRRGMRRIAAPLGFCILSLAVIGMISLITVGVQLVRQSQDTTALRAELEEFLMPMMQYVPQPFDDVNETRQDAPLLAAVWRVTERERIRQLKEDTTVSVYPLDERNRMLIPIKEIETEYAELFGTAAKPYHHTIGEAGMSFTFEYDPDDGCYHIPNASASSMYVPTLDTITKRGDSLTVRVGYVMSTKLVRDDKGELMAPTAAMADYFQLYKVIRRDDGGWTLQSVQNEKGVTTVATSAATTAATTVPTVTR